MSAAPDDRLPWPQAVRIMIGLDALLWIGIFLIWRWLS